MEKYNTGVIYVVLALLVVGQVALFYQISHNGNLALGNKSSTGPVGINTPPVPDPDIVVGGAGPVVDTLNGTVTQISNSSIQIKDVFTGASETAAITTGTTVQIAGAMVDQVTLQKEMAAYNAQITTLIKDPVKNKAALAALHLPSPRIFTPATLPDIAVGDQVAIAATTTTTSGSYVATSITKLPAAQ